MTKQETVENKIWKVLMTYIDNPYGVAGLMGNLYAESRLNPLCLTNGPKKLTGEKMTGAEYVKTLQDATYSEDEFANDGAAFGLAQWCYKTRKRNFYKYIKNSKAYKNEFGSLDIQLDFLVDELGNNYKTVWKTLKLSEDIQECSDIVLTKYEKPANQSDTVKNKRAEYAKKYFDKHAFKTDDNSKDEDDELQIAELCVRTTESKVNIREGNGQEYGILCRIEEKGTCLPYISKTDNGWYAVKYQKKNGKYAIGWISGKYCYVDAVLNLY